MPLILYVFGVNGDLAQGKLFPALHRLFTKNLLPAEFSIVGFGRRAYSEKEFISFVVENLKKKGIDADTRFLKLLSYVQGDFNTLEDYKKLPKEAGNRLFHLAVPPSFYDPIVTRLIASGLATRTEKNKGFTRILIEKPFGYDLKAAKELNTLLKKRFDDDQIYRIDHYIAKRVIRNFLEFRLTNPLFDVMWDKKNIQKVEIQLFESNIVGKRGNFYEKVGALRDIGQNHLLAILALVAMERPNKSLEKVTDKDIQSARFKVLDALEPIKTALLSKNVQKGQYEGYLQDEGVHPQSKVETYFKIKSFLNIPRWKNVPFYIESGKAFDKPLSQVVVHFKNNKLVVSIHPFEKIEIQAEKSKPVELLFKSKVDDPDDAYEKLFLECIAGNQKYFISAKEVEAEWAFITPIIENWGKLPLIVYPQKSKPEDIINMA